MSNKMKYEFDGDRDNIHIYDSQGTELENSPIDATETVELPSDFLPVIAYEMQQEFDANGFSTRMMNIVLACAQPDEYVVKK